MFKWIIVLSFLTACNSQEFAGCEWELTDTFQLSEGSRCYRLSSETVATNPAGSVNSCEDIQLGAKVYPAGAWVDRWRRPSVKGNKILVEEVDCL